MMCLSMVIPGRFPGKIVAGSSHFRMILQFGFRGSAFTSVGNWTERCYVSESRGPGTALVFACHTPGESLRGIISGLFLML